MIAIVTNIKYDTDGQRVKLPKTLSISLPIDIDKEDRLDYVEDEISNITGFCSEYFAVEFINNHTL
jgi:hypothetical protein